MKPTESRRQGGFMNDDLRGDSAETGEWLDALDSVEAFEGLNRVDELLDAVVTSARRKGAQLPFAANTAYVNTIRPEDQPPHPGVRKLEQTIGTVCRKQARRVVEGKREKLTVSREVINEFLGGIQVRVETEVAERVKRPGVAIGLAWTPAGGDILFIEANKMKGKGGFTMTGQIGEVMQESMQAALTWVRSNAASLGLAEDFTKEIDLHIHVPAGAIPKDGPSAGVTMATVLASLLTDTPVRPLTAMTGEITLSGNVLPVGGIKEKFLAARRAGVQTIILPAENRQDVEEDLTPELMQGVTVHYASRIEDVLAVALPLLKARPDKLPSVTEMPVSTAA